jgi:3-dehydroquinate dehydratase
MHLIAQDGVELESRGMREREAHGRVGLDQIEAELAQIAADACATLHPARPA